MNLVKFKKDADLFKSIFDSPLLSNWENFSTANYLPKVRISEDKDNFYMQGGNAGND